MCGIGGILRRDGQAIPDAWIERIDARIAWRGPDGRGRFRDRCTNIDEEGRERTVEIALVHRRLSILDHETGDQPMISERGRDGTEGLLAVVFNGCIYNHRSLRRELESGGHVFSSRHSDTEVLLHGYREWGAALTDHLEGMYAFALWDRHRQSLMLARDWFGEKPLYLRWAIDGAKGTLAFCSDARSLAETGSRHRPFPPRRTRLWTERYLQLGYNFRGATIYDGAGDGAGDGSGDGSGDEAEHGMGGGVRNLPPTMAERIDELMPRAPRETHTEREFAELIDQAVARRLDADVPLGCFLSGGIDSSLIAASAVAHHPDLRTYCVRMPDARYDESHLAAEVAEHLGTRHATLDVTGRNATFAVGNGQMLTGSGSVVGDLTMGSGSTLSPGSSPGALTIEGDLTLDGAELAIGIFADSNNMIQFTSGSLFLDNSPTITINLNDNDFALETKFTIIDGIAMGEDATWTVEQWGAINVIGAPTSWTEANKGFAISEGSVMLTVIPEPSTLGILLLAGLVTIIRRLRMR